jgi:hypothetical protein
MSKTCRKCGGTERYADGRCKACSVARSNAYNAAHPKERKAYGNTYRATHPEEEKARHKAYSAAHQEEVRAYSNAYYTAHPEERRAYSNTYGATHQKERKAHDLKKYSLTLESYDLMLIASCGKCYLCGRPFEDVSLDPAVDHDHLTGKVRGLAHNKCNRAIGLLGDSPEALQRVVDALREVS